MKKIIFIILLFLTASTVFADDFTVKVNVSNFRQMFDQAWELHKNEVKYKIEQAISDAGFDSDITLKNKPYIYLQDKSNNIVRIYTNNFKAMHAEIDIPYSPNAEADIYCKFDANLVYNPTSHSIVIQDITITPSLQNTGPWLAVLTGALFNIVTGCPVPPISFAFGFVFEMPVDDMEYKLPTSYENSTLFRFSSLNYTYGYLIAGFNVLKPISVSISGPSSVFIPNKGEGSNTYLWRANVTETSDPQYKWYKKYSTSSSWTLVGTSKDYTETYSYLPGSGIKTYYLKIKVYDTANRYDEATKTIKQYYNGIPEPEARDDLFAQIIPAEYNLHHNYPNPFNPETTIKYDLPVTSQVNVAIYNTLGVCVRKLNLNGESAGYHQFTWDGKSENGVNVSSGLYVLQFRAVSLEDSKIYQKNIKMLLTR